MPLQGRVCTSCGREYDVLVLNGQPIAVDHEDPDHLGCPDCGGESDVVIGGAVGLWMGTAAGVGQHFPYYDRTFCCEVRSEAHRQMLMEAKGYEETHGDFDAAEVESREQTKRDAIEAEYQAEVDYQMNGPHRAEYRKAAEVIAAEGDKLWNREG